MLKQCNECHIEKVITDFSFRHAIRNIRRHNCKDCCAMYSRNHYLANKDEYYQRHVAKRRRLRVWLSKLKDNPCIDCDTRFNKHLMHFDHLPEYDKFADISEMIADGRSKTAIQAEIAKCELVCLDCHSIRTVDRKQHVGRASQRLAMAAVLKTAEGKPL